MKKFAKRCPLRNAVPSSITFIMFQKYGRFKNECTTQLSSVVVHEFKSFEGLNYHCNLTNSFQIICVVYFDVWGGER